ncbi:DUF3189 family protein [Fictibacillus nanhaiensis]|jgi:hypothetical protein|uniref:DUF3189 family protein n=1 Tax=Fictibacillus nanhaiensis TaxID=742169 RepID=UPI00203CACEB|nr:DUF3189 family protein [Fictibacillus nanhaiensis]MCM3732616.1 DUF3189 family protein [Fictibacillus nanhaiensis]
MIYIYNDYGGTHTTVMAAAFHLNKLPKERLLTRDEILNVDYFNKLDRSDMGRIIFHGVDEEGDSVYTVGRGNSKAFVPGMKNLIEILQEKSGKKERFIFSNTSPTVPLAMTIGGFLSRGLKIDFLGVPLLVVGAKQASASIVQLVQHTKEMAQSSDEDVIILDNTKQLLYSNA